MLETSINERFEAAGIADEIGFGAETGLTGRVGLTVARGTAMGVGELVAGIDRTT